MPSIATPDSDTPSDVVALFLFLGISAVLALFATALTDDAAFRFHGYILMAASAAAISAAEVSSTTGSGTGTCTTRAG